MNANHFSRHLFVCLLFGVMATGAIGAPASPINIDNPQAMDFNFHQITASSKFDLYGKALAPGDLVDFDAAQIAGANYLKQMQADITDDNAGNGTDGVDETPNDPDDGGWDWQVKSPPAPFFHTTANSPTNIRGATAIGVYYTYLETGDASYFTVLTDVVTGMLANSNVRSARDLVLLMLYNDLPGVTGTAYKDTARARYDSRIATYGTASDFAEYVRDVRAASYPNGIIPWDIGAFVRAAAMLDDRFPGNGYDVDADAMAEVVWQDSFNGTPGYFDIEADKGSDPAYGDVNFWWYNLGITGLIEAFSTSGSHTSEIPGLVNRLLESQYPGGAISFQYGATTNDEDWQSTAYAALALADIDQASYQTQINHMGYWIGATQDDVSGGWVYSDSTHLPEVGGENLAALYFTDNTLHDVIVDDDFASQADVDVYNAANSTNYVFGYDAFNSIQDAINAVNGSTIFINDGTYYESNILVNEPCTIEGESRTGVIIAPAAEDDNVPSSTGGTYQQCFIIDTNDVTIKTLTINGEGNPGLTSGKNNYRMAVVTQTGKYVENLVIQDVTIEHTFWRGVYVALTGAGGTLDNCIVNDIEYDAYNAYGLLMLGDGSGGLTGTSVVSNCDFSAIGGRAIGVAYGSFDVTNNTVDEALTGLYCFNYGAAFAGRTITMTGNDVQRVSTGANLVGLTNTTVIGGPGAGDGNTFTMTNTKSAAGTMTDRLPHIGEPGAETIERPAYQPKVGTAYDIGILLWWSDATCTIQGNDVTCSQGDAGMWIFHCEDSTSYPQVRDNSLSATASDGTNTGEGTGIFMTDDGTFLGDENGWLYASLSGNTITGFARGVDLYRAAASPTTGRDVQVMSFTNNSIANCGIGIRTNGGEMYGTTGNTIANNTGDGVAASFGLVAPVIDGFHGNDLSGNGGLGVNNTSGVVIDAYGNWWGGADVATVLAEVSSDVDYAPWWGANYIGDAHASAWTWGMDGTVALQDAIDIASAGDIIIMAAGTYTEGPQVHVAKDITVQGSSAKAAVTLTPTANTGSSGDARAWFLVDAGTNFNLSNVILDGAGFLVYQAIRNKGGGIYTDVTFQNILYNESGPTYSGVGIAAFGDLNVTLDQCIFSNMGRIGALLYGPGLTNSYFTNNVYTGKGDGDWLDYAADISAGAVVTVTGNTITNCTGVASSDGSTSAGLLVTTYFGAGTTANLEGNTISGCTAGLNIGYDASDASTVLVTNGNEFFGNDYGIVTSSSSAISLTVFGNSFFNAVNADDNAGGTWDNGSTGNCWSDFSSNAGYPTNYVVGGTAGAVDNYPSVDCGLDITPDAITYFCTGTFTFDLNLGSAIQDLDGANIGFAYPAELTVVGVTAADANFTLFYNVNDNATGLDTLYVQLGVLSGSQNGPAALYTVEMSGTADYCSPANISMVSADLRDSGNQPIGFSMAAPSTIQADCADPDFTVNGPASGGFYNAAPVLDISATDNCEIDAVYYQVDNCAGGTWTAIATGVSATAYNDAAWILSEFASLSEASHCIYFKVVDVNGRGNSDSCTFSWCFTKDVTAPPPPTNLTAAPGHNKVKLNWTNATSDFDHTVVMRTDWYAGGHGYPRYGQLNAEGLYPQDTIDGDFITSTTTPAHVDTYDLSNATRDVYHYAAFTVDAAGNVSAAGASEARSTSYWLGDLADPTTTLGAFDGYVYFGDLYQFSLTYAKAVTDAGFIYDANFGPTHNSSATGIPVPDDSVQFEDLIIFAINYDAVNPTMKAVPLLPAADVTGPLALELQPVEQDGQTSYELAIRNNTGDLKGLHAVIDIGSALIKNVHVNDALKDADNPVFVDYREVDGRVILDLAILGTGRTLAGSGVLAAIELDDLSAGHSNPALIEGLMRDGGNKELSVTLVTSSPVNLPTTYALLQNYPNPFNPSTEIAFDLPEQSQVKLEIFSIVGQRVTTLIDQPMEAGHQTVTWDGTNSSGQRVASGVYLYRLTADGFTASRKMVLVK